MILDALTLDDCLEVVKWRNEDISGLRTPYFLGEEMQIDFYNKVICNRESPHKYIAIREEEDKVLLPVNGTTKDNILIGMGGLTDIDWINRQAEISLIIAPFARGKGLGKEAAVMVIEWGFKTLNLDYIYGECYNTNETGLQFWHDLINEYGGWESNLPCVKYWKGQYWDGMYFKFRREDFVKV